MTEFLGQETQVGDIIKVLGVRYTDVNILFEITNIDVKDDSIILDLISINSIAQKDEYVERVERRLEISSDENRFLDIENEDELIAEFLGPIKLAPTLLNGLQCNTSYDLQRATEGLEEFWYSSQRTGLHLQSLHCMQLPPAYFSHPRVIDRLKSLFLRYNLLGFLPPEIWDLTNLETLLVRGSELLSIPPEIGKLVNLQQLDLSDNELKFLPLEIGSLPYLEKLRVEGNRFTLLPGGNKQPMTILEFQEAWQRSIPSIKSARKR